MKHFLEYIALLLFFGLCKIMSLDKASAFGGWLGRTIGPRLATSRKAMRNLENALPDLEDKDAVIREMWDNLGRTLAEYPHLEQIGRERVRIVNEEMFQKVAASDSASIFIGGHFANWEMYSVAFTLHFGEMGGTYRAPNNPRVDTLINRLRSLNGRIPLYSKSREGGRGMIQALKDGQPMGILIDQKYNEGLAVDFFGRPAMTNPVFAQLAKKNNYPLIPAQIIRENGANFTMIAYDPIPTEGRTIEEIMREAHIYLEEWIKQNPGQWLWLHRRWDSKALSETE